MKCASCGRDNPVGARFCVHCGTEQASTPIAVAAAANAARSRAMPQAANAPQAQSAQASQAQRAQAANAPRVESSRTSGRSAGTERPRVVREHAAPWGADTQPPAFPAGSDPFDITGDTYAATPPKRVQPITPAAVPVYASHPRRLGVAALLIALCVIVALVGFVLWKTRAGAPPAPPIAESDSSVMSTFPPDETPHRPAPSGATSPMERAQSASGATADSTSTATAAPPVRTPVEIKPLPAKPARKPAATTAPKLSPPPPAAVAAPEPVPAPAPPPVAAAPRKVPPVDRWAQMSEELSRCTREDFITRVICDQRVRFRYCDGYWGKTAQCPGNPVPDRQ